MNTTLSQHKLQAGRALLRARNDTPMQQRLRREKQWFIGAVYWQPGHYDVQKLVREFRRMRALGFNTVRFHTADPELRSDGTWDFTRPDDWMNAALEAGLGVIFQPHPHRYPAGYLQALGARYRRHPALFAWGLLGEPKGGDGELDAPAFAAWLRGRYGSLEALDRAWNIYPGHPLVTSFDQAGLAAQPGDLSYRSYGARRDIMRFQTEQLLEDARKIVREMQTADPDHPVAVGSHQLFLNQPLQRWDIPEWARLGDLHYSSIHLSWHFDLVEGEIDRPVYMQARLTRDAFKGGWTSCFETTGGAVQYSGGYGNAMTPGLMRRLMLSYLAAGNLNIAFWTWNHRPGWWEQGEYGLTTYSGEISAWAKEAGRIAKAVEQYAEELWEAEQPPRVGILQNWDNEAILLCEPERHDLQSAVSDWVRGTKSQASRASIGVARALLNHHIPFEYFSGHELLAGGALAYPVVYAPHLRAVSVAMLEKLKEYVAAGGRLIADVQFGFCDQWGKMHPRDRLEPLFGASVDMIHDARTNPAVGVEGCYGELKVTTAKVRAKFKDGTPSIVEHAGAVLIAFDAGHCCWKPGNTRVEKLIASLVGGEADWNCAAPLAFRLRAKQADHYFLLNDGPARPVTLRGTLTDVLTGKRVPNRFRLPAYSGLWLRAQAIR